MDRIQDLSGHRRELVREGLTMALYVGLSLLAVMVALPPDVTPAASSSPATVLFLTAIGLLVAHAFAFRISARLVHRGQLTSQHLELLGVQLVGGLAVTAVAVIPVLLIGGPTGVFVSELLLLAFISIVGYAAARTISVSRWRAAAYMAGVVAVTLVVLWVKGLVVH